MKKILFFFCACAMVVVMSSCGGGADTSTPQGVMEAYFKCAQKGDIDGIVELMDLKDDTQKDTYKGLLKLGEEEMKKIKDYKIKDVKEDGDKATVTYEMIDNDGNSKDSQQTLKKDKDGNWKIESGK